MKNILSPLALLVILSAGCEQCNSDGINGRVTKDTGEAPVVDTDDTGGPDPDTSDTSDTDTGEDVQWGDAYFDDPGDIVEMSEGSDGSLELPLTDASGDSNEDQEFYLVLVNTSSSAVGYTLEYTEAEAAAPTDTGGAGGQTAGPVAPPAAREWPAPVVSPFRQHLREYIKEKGGPGLTTGPRPPAPALSDEDIGSLEQKFHVRDNIDSEISNQEVTANLWALGDTIAIWVDEDVAIDWDKDCDGFDVSQGDVKHVRESWGFDNCDLQTIADIVDVNIIPNIQSIFGEVSDVNGDDRVSVLVTPVLNRMPFTDTDTDNWASVVEAYADPEVDLNDYSLDNPVSDEQEIIYIFAPDPYGYYNSLYNVDVAAYTSMTMAARIAQVLENLVSYNQKVLSAGEDGEAEERWVDLALGAIAADLTGFGAIYYDDAWDYLDLTHLEPLVTSGVSSVVSGTDVGAQFLFARWLVDTWGTEVLSDIVGSPYTGTTAIEGATSTSFDDLMMFWQLALLTTGVSNSAGELLVDDEEWSLYNDATTVPVGNPDVPDGYYGAYGYQMGINLHGVNSLFAGGTTASAVADEAQQVKLENVDPFTYVPDVEFHGFIEGNYAAQVVRLREIHDDAVNIELRASDSGLKGLVVRWFDPERQDLAVENIFSATDTNAIDLTTLLEDGSKVYGIGAISDSTIITLYDTDGDDVQQNVNDTDRWRLDLSGRVPGQQVWTEIMLERRYESLAGDIAPFDPWLVVVPEIWVPTPTPTTYTRNMCPATGAPSFTYPMQLLEYMYAQVVLADIPTDVMGGADGEEEDTGGGDEDAFDACGMSELDSGGELPDCSNDWDSDGVLDADEPQPQNFLQQVWVQQCFMGVDASEYLTDAYVDADSMDDDDDPSYDRMRNTGGAVDSSGEEAFWYGMLQGGISYLIVVGGSGDQGAYELIVRQVE